MVLPVPQMSPAIKMKNAMQLFGFDSDDMLEESVGGENNHNQRPNHK